MTEHYEFQVGDVVSFGGIEGEVEIRDVLTKYPIVACGGYSFTRDGRFNEDQTEPILKLVRKAEKPKKLVKKTMWQAVKKGVTGQWIDEYVFNTKEEAMHHPHLVPVVGAVAVEVEMVEE